MFQEKTLTFINCYYCGYILLAFIEITVIIIISIIVIVVVIVSYII